MRRCGPGPLSIRWPSGVEGAGLRHVDHPDPRARRRASDCLRTYGTPLLAEVVVRLLRLARDPVPSVRCSAALVPRRRRLTGETRAARLTLVRDEEAGVRVAAGHVPAASGDRTAEVADALAALLDEDELRVRLEGAYGLSLRDDLRTALASEWVGELTGPEYEYDDRAEAIWRWQLRNRPEGT
ncbi:hypothetical protein ACWC9T_18930 [Kitasatospora sp. NPDC001159]